MAPVGHRQLFSLSSLILLSTAFFILIPTTIQDGVVSRPPLVSKTMFVQLQHLMPDEDMRPVYAWWEVPL